MASAYRWLLNQKSTFGAHPFSTGSDQCLVHNGSLSNHNLLRRKLSYEGIEVEADNGLR